MGVWRSGSVIRQASKPVVRSVSIIHKQLVSVSMSVCVHVCTESTLYARAHKIYYIDDKGRLSIPVWQGSASTP